MTTHPTLLALLTMACVPGVCLSATPGETVSCPAVFPMATLRFVPADPDWIPQPGERAPRLVGWGLNSGPPAQLAALIPSGESRGYFSWKLEGPFPEGVWVHCVYADGALTLARRLAATTGTCTAPTRQPRTGKPQPVSFVCR